MAKVSLALKARRDLETIKNYIAESEGNTLKEYVYLNGQPFAQIIGSDIYYYHNSHIGTPEVMTDELQNIVWQASYTPFGKATISINTIKNNIRFPGQYFDSETELHYNYFRDYDPEIGRYIQSDPIGLAGGINTYAYVEGNPIKYTDPKGLLKFCSRALGNLPRWANFSPYPKSQNLGVYHEHGFYEDSSGEGTGYGPQGLFNGNPNDERYECEDQSYYDNIMREAEKNIASDWKAKDYDVTLNNCQDYVSDLKSEYWSILYERQATKK